MIEKGNFTWAQTIEGHNFWRNICFNKNYTEFYKKYPKIEQYYTSIPGDVKVGDKFEIIGGKGIGEFYYSYGWPIGSIVTLNRNDGSKYPSFKNDKRDTLYLDWGWLKPVKDVSVNNKK